MATGSAFQSTFDWLANVELSTKHTFIHLLPQKNQTMKRSSSAPHLSCYNAIVDAANVKDCASQPKVSDESEVSTELAAESSFESTSTAPSTPSTPMLAEMTPMLAEVYPMHMELLDNPCFPPIEASPKQGSELEIFGSLYNQASPKQGSELEIFGSLYNQACSIQPSSQRTDTRTSLNSRAKAWTPTGNSFAAPFPSMTAQEVHNQFVMLMMAVQTMMSADESISEAQALETGCCWSLALQICPEYMYRMANIVMLAQDAFRRASAQSGNTYIIGHRSKPFKPTPMGFTVVLGTVLDESTACWDMVSWGRCPRKCTCRWQHPEHLVTVNVTIKIANT